MPITIDEISMDVNNGADIEMETGDFMQITLILYTPAIIIYSIIIFQIFSFEF